MPPYLTLLFLCFPGICPLLEALVLDFCLCFLPPKSSNPSNSTVNCFPSSLSQHVLLLSKVGLYLQPSSYPFEWDGVTPAFCLLNVKMLQPWFCLHLQVWCRSLCLVVPTSSAVMHSFFVPVFTFIPRSLEALSSSFEAYE